MDRINNFQDILHQPAQFLVENIDLLPRGRALDVAMGSGRNAVYLARMGFQVEGVDASREAVEEALKNPYNLENSFRWGNKLHNHHC